MAKKEKKESKADMAMDRKKGIKEGSMRDEKIDAKKFKKKK